MYFDLNPNSLYNFTVLKMSNGVDSINSELSKEDMSFNALNLRLSNLCKFKKFAFSSKKFIDLFR